MNSYRVKVSLSSPLDENPRQPNDKRIRLDQYICGLQLKGLETRNQLKRLQAEVWKDGKQLKFSHSVKDGEELLIRWQQAQHYDASAAVEMDLDILYEDANLIVLNKPQGLAVHGAPSLNEPSLVQGLIAKYRDLLQNFDVDSEFRPGIVHRLDKDTSGVLLIARNTEMLRLLSEQFAKRRVQKTYYAIVHGQPKQGHGTVDLPLMRDPRAPQRYTVYKPQRLIGRIGGQSMNHEELQDFYRESGLPLRNSKVRNAETHYRVLRTWQDFSLVRLRPSTGRTHQLRVHLKNLGCPIVGDPIYGKKQADSSLMLHAFRLEFCYPDEVRMAVQVATPKHFREFLHSLR